VAIDTIIITTPKAIAVIAIFIIEDDILLLYCLAVIIRFAKNNS
jgi:hypothetical protein